ncbi:MAG TPA: hypothetical protein VK586_07010 [Streptosporangiaceae bacterium]|jgi:hypothetical protein|nr:hypothetical protein [Streptosporangiaceae bacterium]
MHLRHRSVRTFLLVLVPLLSMLGLYAFATTLTATLTASGVPGDGPPLPGLPGRLALPDMPGRIPPPGAEHRPDPHDLPGPAHLGSGQLVAVRSLHGQPGNQAQPPYGQPANQAAYPVGLDAAGPAEQGYGAWGSGSAAGWGHFGY